MANTNGQKSLHEQCRLPFDEDALTALLLAGADINAKDAAGQTPLHVAVGHARTETTLFLLIHGASESIVDNQGHTATEGVIHGTDLHDALQKLAQFRNDEAGLVQDMFSVIHNESVDAVNRLLMEYGDWGLPNSVGQLPEEFRNGREAVDLTPIMHAIQVGNVDILHRLLSRVNVDVNRKAGGCAAIHHAVTADVACLVRLLKVKRLNIDAVNQAGETAVHLAVQNKNQRVLVHLLDRDASRGIPNAARMSPVELAQQTGAKQMLAILLEYEKGGKVPRASHDYTPEEANQSALDQACGAGDIVTVTRLVTEKHVTVEGATATASHSPGVHGTPLCRAAAAGHVSVVAFLLDQGAHIDRIDEATGSTALHQAAHAGHVPVIELLLARGASVNKKDQYGHTPLDVVVAYEPGKLLSDHGGRCDRDSYYGKEKAEAAARGQDSGAVNGFLGFIFFGLGAAGNLTSKILH